MLVLDWVDNSQDDSVAQIRTTDRSSLGRPIYGYLCEAGSLEFIMVGQPDLRPLVILQALEYPAWPDKAFCERAVRRGFRVIAVRRPGFGQLPPLANLERQAGLISGFLARIDATDCILVSSGTSNAYGYRLAGDPRVGLTVLANCCFNYDAAQEIRPEWFAKAIRDSLTSETGARLAQMGFKGAVGLFGKFWATESFMQKSEGDLKYLRANRDLFKEAIDCLLEGMDIHTYILELRSTLMGDDFLGDGCLDGAPVIAVSGSENSDAWKVGIGAEAERVGVPLHFLPSGDALVIYQSPGEILDLLDQYA